MQVSPFPAIFKADFSRFQQVSAVFGLFRPYRPPANTTRYGRYGPILAESARFGSNRSRFGTNQAALTQIEPRRRESEKKKKKKKKKTQTRTDARATMSDAGVAPLVPRPCFLGVYYHDSNSFLSLSSLSPKKKKKCFMSKL